VLNRKYVKALSWVLLFVFGFSMVPAAYADGAAALTQENVKIQENCTVTFEGDKLTVTDTDDNNDVWSSKLLLDAGMELISGEQYKVSFTLSGENGVGEFFLCKSENPDDRYDKTFASEPGSRAITFTAVGSKVYIGLQIGNLGKGNTVTVTVSDMVKLSESACPELLRTENGTVSVENGVITATDDSDNNDVWNSKLLYAPNVSLEPGKTYTLHLDLSGENGVGEFFVCKSPDLNDRYDATFVNAAGAGTVTFKAAGEKLYIGMQFGNLGKGNTVTAVIGAVEEAAPAKQNSGTTEPGTEEPSDPNAVNCSYTANGNTITVTDLGDNNDVWDSKLLYDAGIELEPGKKYEIHFTLSGDNGVGEFFLCKSMDINDRYDETFSSAAGEKTVVITAVGTRAYIGLQVGNLGKGNSMTASVSEVKEYNETAKPEPRVIAAENCTYEIETNDPQTVIEATDTSDNNDVWNSKLLYFLGDLLEKGCYYAANFNLSGENGVGEFFFCKTDNLDDRYSFDNTAGDHTAKFTAEDESLYAGMQFGNIGEGNEVKVSIFDIFRVPGLQTNSENCFENLSRNTIKITDSNEDNAVWTSKAVYNTGIVLEPGKTYTATFTLSGENGVGEFFFLKSDNTDDRYTFDNEAGEHTVTFVADGTNLFFGFQCGNIGNGNSVTLSNVSISAVDEESSPNKMRMTMAAIPETDTEPDEIPCENASDTETEGEPETAFEEPDASEENVDEENASPEEPEEAPAEVNEDEAESASEEPDASEENTDEENASSEEPEETPAEESDEDPAEENEGE